jgi:NAD(P)-dependent dehydrogenase (short-subunit alcohol dehydrogenase family)
MDNKVIFITGGNEGIGFATARLFAGHGARVAIMGRRPDKNLAACEQIIGEGGECIALTGDVSHRGDVENALAECFGQFGALHYAFNNAGVEQVPRPLLEQTEEEYEQIFNINVKAVWHCMQLQIPYLLKSGGGCIVNNSSASGHTGTRMVPLYSASKHALQGLTKSVALEYAQQGIRVNAVCPGAIDTPAYEKFAGHDPQMMAQIEAGFPMGRIGRPEEVAAAVLYLCRDASFTTGSSLMMDGGRTAQ